MKIVVLTFLFWSILFANVLPSFAQDSSSQESAQIKETPIDIEISPFKDTPVGREFIKQNGTTPLKRDSWGYPPPTNIYQKLKPKTNNQPKSTFIKKIFNALFFDTAYAYDYPIDDQIPGLVHCRSTPQVTGYFKAYFEDMALNNGLGTNDGYDHPQLGAGRRNVACDVLVQVSTLIKLNETNLTPDILFVAGMPSNAPSNALAAASAFFGSSTNTFDNGTLHRHITTRQDPSPDPGSFDALVYTNWGTGVSWSVDSSTNPQLNSTNYDFHSVLLHEVLHALGFRSGVPAVISATNNIDTDNYSINLYQSLGGYPFFSNSQPLSPTFQAIPGVPSPWFISNSVIYNGRKNYVAAPLDGARPVYSPANWQQGSSLSHFDISRANGAVYVMNPGISPGLSRTIHEHEKEVLCHLGYAVNQLAGCEKQAPVARDDIKTIIGTSTCVSLLLNDISSNGTAANLIVHQIQTVNPPTSGNITFHTTTNCSSSSLTNDLSVTRAILVTGTDTVVLKYKIKDTSSSLISSPATIRLTNCTSDPNEYVCNGNFELEPLGSLNNGANAAFYLNDIPFWASAEMTPDLVFRNQPGYEQSHNTWNVPYVLYPSLPNSQKVLIDLMDSGSQAAFIRELSPTHMEKITTKLKAPLTPGQSYILSFDIHIHRADGTVSTTPGTHYIKAGLSLSNMDISALNPALASTSFTVVNKPISVNQSIASSSGVPSAKWTHVSQVFTPAANQAYNYLVLYMPYYGAPIHAYIDNVSIKTNFPDNSISGVVYNDLNSNGSRNGEPGLNGITIGLFSSSNSMTPIQTTQTVNTPATDGYYKFPGPNVALMPAANYYVAIVDENLFPLISQPVTNSFMLNFHNSRKIPFASGGNITGQDFGVLLSGQLMKIKYTKREGCGVVSDNDINLTVVGGTPPFTYTWTKQGGGYSYTGQDPTMITPGVYNVLVTDSSIPMLTGSMSITINPFTPMQVQPNIYNATAPNYNNGKITLTITGGSPPYTYLWSNGATTPSIQNLPASDSITYGVVVRDSYNCPTRIGDGMKILKKEYPRILPTKN